MTLRFFFQLRGLFRASARFKQMTMADAAFGIALCCFGVFSARARRRRSDRVLVVVICTLLLLFRVNIDFATRYLRDTKANNNGKRLFILSGQSNMAGRGGLVRKDNAVKKQFDAQLLQYSFERELVIPDGNVERLTASMKWVPGKPFTCIHIKLTPTVSN